MLPREPDACAPSESFRGNLGEDLLPLFFGGLFCGHVGYTRLREAPACFLTAQTFLGDSWIHE